jgi:lipopolysaccharide export system permease protein
LRLLDRYLLRQVLFACLGAIGFFTFVLLAGNVLKDLLAFIVAGQLTLWSALPLMALLVPFVIVYALPMGMLCGILLVLGRLSAESETVAMRAAGLSLRRIAMPIYGLALLGVAGAVAVNLYYMPLAITRQKQELARIVRGDPLKMIVPKTFVRDFRNCVVYVNEKNGQELRDIWIWELDSEKRVERFVRAESGRLELDETGDQLQVTLFRASVESRSSKDPEDFSQPPATGFFESTSRSLSLEWLFGKSTFRRKLKWLTWEELGAEVERLSKPIQGLADSERIQQLMNVKITMQEKLATAFTVFSFALIAVPLGIKVSRRETSANLGMALLLAMSYYFLTIMVHWLDNQPALRPDLLLWVPNLVFLVVALRLHSRAERA